MGGSNSENEPQIVDTGSGLLVGGHQPAQRVPPVDWQPQQGQPQQQLTQPPSQPPQQGQPQQQQPQFRWTDEDLERVRQQEKDKLYGRIDEVQQQLRQIQADREQEQAERQRLADEAAEAQRLREESEMEVRDLLARKETEWQSQLSKLEQRYDADRAVFEKERAFAQVQEYRRDRIEQEQEFILPELRDLISGDTPEAIDASINVMKARSEQIFTNMAAATQQPQIPFQPRGAAPTAPPVGPMEQMPSYESLTPDDIRNMDMETYKRYRGQLLQATNPNRRRQ
jgi:hypothetical protein